MDLNPTDAAIAMHAFASYLHNTSALQFVEEVYGADKHPTYLREKAERYDYSPVLATGQLDVAHFHKLTAIAVKRYGDASRAFLQSVPIPHGLN